MDIIVVRARLRLDRKGQLRLGLAQRPRASRRTIGNWMRRLRKQHGVTAEGLAAYLGCSTAALRRLECGKARLSAWVVADYLKILGYDLVLVEIGS